MLGFLLSSVDVSDDVFGDALFSFELRLFDWVVGVDVVEFRCDVDGSVGLKTGGDGTLPAFGLKKEFKIIISFFKKFMSILTKFGVLFI